MKSIIDLINEHNEEYQLINEDLSSDIIRDLKDTFKKKSDSSYYSINSMKQFYSLTNLQLDKLTDDDIDEYDMYYVNKTKTRSDEFLKAVRKITQGKDYGFILVYENDKPICIIRQYITINYFTGGTNSAFYRSAGTSCKPNELFSYILQYPSLVYICHVDSEKDANKIRNERYRNQPNPTNDPEYFKRIAKENVERYKKIISTNKAAGNEQTKIFSELVDKITVEMVSLSKKFAENPEKYNYDFSAISNINEEIFNRNNYSDKSLLNLFGLFLKKRSAIKKYIADKVTIGDWDINSFNDFSKALCNKIRKIANMFETDFNVKIDVSSLDKIKVN